MILLHIYVITVFSRCLMYDSMIMTLTQYEVETVETNEHIYLTVCIYVCVMK